MGLPYRGLLERTKENEVGDSQEQFASESGHPEPPALTVVAGDASDDDRRAHSAGEPPLPLHLLKLKRTIHRRLLGRHAVDVNPARRQEIRDKIVGLLEEHQREGGEAPARSERDRLVGALLDDICGLGPLQQLMDDPGVTEVMINHHAQVFIEREGRITLSDVQFDDESGEGDSLVVERERDLALSGQARQMIADIDAALQRLDNGTYGLSTVSGRPIPKERLRAIPWATELVEEKVGGLGRR